MFLASVIRGEVTEKIPIGIGGGEQMLIDNTPGVKDRRTAAETLGKRYGLWVDHQQVERQVVVVYSREKSN